MADVAGRLAVVTGAGSGIGRELALQLAADGANLALCDINEATLQETAEACRARRPATVVSTMVVDVSDRARADEFARSVATAHGTTSVDLLFNNAGIGGGESFIASDEAEWDRTFDITWGGTYRMTRAFLPMLLASTSADIVNVSSINGEFAALGDRSPVSAYSTAKFAVKGFTESLQRDLQVYAPHVRATLVMPGAVSSSISVNTLALHGRQPLTMTAEQLQAERKRLQARGFDVTNVDDDALRADLDRAKDAIERSALLTPAQAASEILAGIRAGHWRIVVGDDAIAIDRVVRRFPVRTYRWSRNRLGVQMLIAAPVRIGRVAVRVAARAVRAKLVRR